MGVILTPKHRRLLATSDLGRLSGKLPKAQVYGVGFTKLSAKMFEEYFHLMTNKRVTTLQLVREDQAYVPTHLRPSAYASRASGHPQIAEEAARPERLPTRPSRALLVPASQAPADRRDRVLKRDAQNVMRKGQLRITHYAQASR